MNYTDEDVHAIVDTQVELKTKELQARIDKAIKLIHSILENPEAYNGKDNVNNILSILNGDDE